MSNLLRKIEFIKINRNGEVSKDMNWLKIIDSLLVNCGWIYSFGIHANDVAEKTDYFTMSKRGNPTLTYGSGLELYGFLHMNNIDQTISNIVKESPWASTEWIVTLQFHDGDNTDMYAQFFWDNKIVTRVEKDIYRVNEL